jgi:hypothetical protein
MPKAVARTEPGRIANNREALSSATQLSAFGTRLAKFTYRFSADGATDFSSNYDLPAACRIKSVSVYSAAGVTGATDAVIEAGGTPITGAIDMSVTGAQAPAVTAETESGELSINFTAAPTAGEATIAVEYIDLSEIK